jgi:hypothetical protein
MREGPEAQLFLADLPKSGQPGGLDDQEKYDEGAEYHLRKN